MTRVKLRLTGRQYTMLKQHLLPGDGLEAVALALCGRCRKDEEHILCVRKVVPVPYSDCDRRHDRVRWQTDMILPLVEEASKTNAAIFKIHSHPAGGRSFSAIDDTSDRSILASVFSWVDSDEPHASAIMLPDGEIYGRAMLESGQFSQLSGIAVVGDDLVSWYPEAWNEVVPEFARRHAQLFGAGTTARLKRLTIAVVGCSGTGSIVVELLARLGVGQLVLIDPEKVEEKNLNRIINATKEDAYLGRFKVEVAARAIARMGFGTEVRLIRENLLTAEAVKAVATSDVVFGCMDSAEGRHALNRLATFYILPYFDVGVRLDADGKGGIDEVCGAVHFLQPDGSSLLSRGVYSMERVNAEALRRTNPAMYEEHVRTGYIRGVDEDRPAVISVNMELASMTVNEFLARIHPYRYDENSEFSIVRTSLIQGQIYREADGTPCSVLSRHTGRGDVRPLLDMPVLSG